MFSAETLKKAIAGKLQITAYYDGHYREFCPHMIGWKKGVYHLLTYQFAGSSSRGLPPGGEWRCFNVSELSNVQARHGQWHTGSNHTKPQTCIDEIEAEVSH
jgi:hypothetical protein